MPTPNHALAPHVQQIKDQCDYLIGVSSRLDDDTRQEVERYLAKIGSELSAMAHSICNSYEMQDGLQEECERGTTGCSVVHSRFDGLKSCETY